MEDLILATDVNRHKDFMAQFEVSYPLLTSNQDPRDLKWPKPKSLDVLTIFRVIVKQYLFYN